MIWIQLNDFTSVNNWQTQNLHFVSLYPNEKMSDFLPSKQHIREVLLFCYNWNKRAAEARRMLVEVYGDCAPPESTCRSWYQRFKDGDYELVDKNRSGRPKSVEDQELKALLDEDPTQLLKQLAKALGVSRSGACQRLQKMGMHLKNGLWMPQELKPRDIESRLMICKMLLQRQKQQPFLHQIVTGDRKWIYFNDAKRKRMHDQPSTPEHNPELHVSRAMLCIWWDQHGVIDYELLQPDQPVNAQIYQLQIMRLNSALHEKRSDYFMTNNKVVFQHNNVRLHADLFVQQILERLEWDVLAHPALSPDITPSHYHLFPSMTYDLCDEHLESYEDTMTWLDRWIKSKEQSFFHHGIHTLEEKWQKVITNHGNYCN